MRLAVGCMTGTSIDALDAALVAVEGAGLEMRPRFVRGVSRPLGTLAAELRALASQEPMAAGRIAAAAHGLALLHVEAIRELIEREQPELVCVHGQTVYHAPPLSWQLMSPGPIAHGLGVPVVFDLRAADLARGGQGAPITPLADWMFFRADEPVAVVNLGGFCNVTLLPAQDDPGPIERIGGFDVCACNHLLDEVSRRVLGRPFDTGGERALHGRADSTALADLARVLATQAAAGRSLGTGDECAAWIGRFAGRVSADDLAATACEGLAGCIVPRIAGVHRVLLAGGGVKNLALVRAIETRCAARVEATDAHGLPGDCREAAAMAVLGLLCKDRVPITLPTVTGVRKPAPIAGSWVMP